MSFKALWLTILVSFFFLIGLLIPKFFKNKNKLTLFTTGLTFIVMLYLIFFDLFLEIVEIFSTESSPIFFLLAFFGVGAGILFLKILDDFIPEHSHHHQEKNDDVKEHNAHLYHIGFITSVSLIIHNILEGISIYVTGLADLKLGFFMALTVGCHNLPLGIEIATCMDAYKEKWCKKYFILLSLILSSFLGAFFLYLLNLNLNIFIEGVLLSITMGMLIYISLFELLKEIKENFKTEVKLGIVVGVFLTFVLYLL